VNAEFRWTRRTPANPQINLNFQLGLPPGVDPASLGAEGQRVLQELISNVGQVLPGMVQQEINRQSPVSGVEARTFGGRWVRKPAGGGEAVDGL